MSTLVDTDAEFDLNEQIHLVENLRDSLASRSSDFPITIGQKIEFRRHLAQCISESTCVSGATKEAKDLASKFEFFGSPCIGYR